MRVQRRDGKTVHFGTRSKRRGGYDILCKRHKLVPLKDWKRTKKPINCPDCLEKRAEIKQVFREESLQRKAKRGRDVAL